MNNTQTLIATLEGAPDIIISLPHIYRGHSLPLTPRADAL
jgi:hypothetical protein